jgi:dipeptidyl aminopeptidase/acylaminoacyl peptidase
MYRVNIATGEVNLEAENPGDIDAWVTDAEFHIRAATALDAETNDTIIRIRDNVDAPWRDIVHWDFYEVGSVLYKKVLGFTPDGAGIYVQSPMGSEMSRLVVLDGTTGEETQEIASTPESDLWNIWWEPQVVINPHTHVVEAVGFCYLKPRWQVIDPSVKKDYELLLEGDKGIFHITARTNDDTKWMVMYSADVMPARYYLYDRPSGKLTHLFDELPELADYTLAPMQAVTYLARDGMKVPSYLTVPVGVDPENLPLVIAPHGGPWARDQWGFDPWTQLLANRGYAVLQPNFRGSTGYGKNHLNAGNKQWGGDMQNDLSDGVKWAIDTGLADPDRVAIMGGSYGGYATLAGMAFTPELYRCGIDMVGPSNVKTLFESFPPYWSVRKKRWIKRVGDVEGDEEWNRKISPLFHADQIRAPMLIAHGANDVRVKQAESDAIVEAMKKNNLPVTYVVYPDEGHDLARGPNNMDFMGRVEEFLEECLGGRKEPWREEPGTTAEVRWAAPPSRP